MVYKKIGIVIADDDEFIPFSGLLKEKTEYNTSFRHSVLFRTGDVQFFAVCSGMGKVNAAAATMFLIDRGCEAIFNFGLSGGLKGVKRGQFILPDSFIEHDFDLTPLGYKPCEKPLQDYIYKADKELLSLFSEASGAYVASTAVCGDRFISDKKTGDFLIDTFSASSCDMETAAMASVCHLMNVPFVSMRRISDDAGDNASDSYSDMNRNDGKTLSAVFIDSLHYICGEV